MRHRYVITNDGKKILYVDATNLYGHSVSQTLPYDEIELWHGHPDLHMNKLEEISNSLDDSLLGYFFEVDLKHPIEIKEKKQKTFHFVLKTKYVMKLVLVVIRKKIRNLYTK